MTIAFDNSYARLPERFFAPTPPTPVRAPRLIRLNRPLAGELGLDADWLQSEEGVAVLAGNRLAAGSAPIAMAYAGHQFGQFVPQLGDGRAILLGEVIDRAGSRRDIVLKGAGPTRFSRSGDGRAALGPVLREYIVSEAFAALGVPTTRALAAVLTGDGVVRETILPGAVLARVAASHVRVGTFQFFAARRDVEGLRALADHVIDRHYPAARAAAIPALALLESVIVAQAELIARWLCLGFIHGVMNTDNMTISGETIDYGPCAFLDAYDTDTVLSAIDAQGRYAYGNQPSIALWNLTRFAETLLPLIAEDPQAAVPAAQEALAAFGPRFEAAYEAGLAAKLGLDGAQPEDQVLVSEFLALMAKHQADFTLTFRLLATAPESAALAEAFGGDSDFADWLARWRERVGPVPPAAMRRANPAYIPRNHRVEAVIQAAVERADFGPFEELLAVLAEPFVERPEFARYADPPAPHERVRRTFCGT